MDLNSILASVRKTIDAAQAVADPLATLGVPYAGLARALLEVAENVEKRISDGTVVATSDQRDVVKNMIEELQAVNDGLAAEIDAS